MLLKFDILLFLILVVIAIMVMRDEKEVFEDLINQVALTDQFYDFTRVLYVHNFNDSLY